MRRSWNENIRNSFARLRAHSLASENDGGIVVSTNSNITINITSTNVARQFGHMQVLNTKLKNIGPVAPEHPPPSSWRERSISARAETSVYSA